MALERADVWWLPALYLQKSELEPPPRRDATLRRALELARAQNSRSLERRILASSTARPRSERDAAVLPRLADRSCRERFLERFGNARPHTFLSGTRKKASGRQKRNAASAFRRRRNVMNRTGLFAATLILGLLAPAGYATRATGSSAAVVFEWNQILQDSFPTQGVGTVRPFSLTHIAMFDAINAIEREFEPYHVRLRHAGGSPEAAAAQAAHDVLVGLNPAAAATYDAALARQLGSRPSGFTRQGAAVGATVAKEVLDWRKSDGWLVSPPPPPYVEPKVPGRWQPTPGVTAATFTHLQNAAPLALPSPTLLLPAPPPTIDSDRYAADLNEVKLLGQSDSIARTPEQTAIARLWAGVSSTGTGRIATNFLSMLNNVVRAAAEARQMSLVDTARLFTLVNLF